MSDETVPSTLSDADEHEHEHAEKHADEHMSAHEHHHEHEHAGHEHHHEHDHEGHEHHHEHEEDILIDGSDRFLSMLDHEGQLVASYRLDLPGSLDDAKKTLSAFTESIADAIYAQGGIVGHIKAFARSQGDSFRISITVHDPDIIDFSDSSVHVEGVAIVFGVDKAWYEAYMTEKVQTLR